MIICSLLMYTIINMYIVYVHILYICSDESILKLIPEPGQIKIKCCREGFWILDTVNLILYTIGWVDLYEKNIKRSAG